MWQLYAQTAIDLVRERQLEAERYAAARGTERLIRQPAVGAVRRTFARGISAFGRATGALADASCALATRVGGPVTNN